MGGVDHPDRPAVVHDVGGDDDRLRVGFATRAQDVRRAITMVELDRRRLTR